MHDQPWSAEATLDDGDFESDWGVSGEGKRSSARVSIDDPMIIFYGWVGPQYLSEIARVRGGLLTSYEIVRGRGDVNRFEEWVSQRRKVEADACVLLRKSKPC